MSATGTQRTKVLHYVDKQTTYALNQMNQTVGSTASEVSKNLEINRANCSRILNSLYTQGLLIKRIGKPTYFLSKKAILSLYPKASLPSIISKEANVYRILEDSSQKQLNSTLALEIDQIIGASANESLFQCVRTIEKTTKYPGTTFALFLLGKEGTGKEYMISKIIQFLELYVFMNRKYTLAEIDASAEKIGQEKIDSLHKGLQNKRNFVIVVKHFEFLPRMDLFKLKKLVNENQQHYAANSNFFIFSSSNTASKNPNFLSVYSEMDQIIRLPEYHLRTAKEKVEFIFDQLQKEATLSKRTIKIDKNSLCCIAMSGSILSLNNLRHTLRSTLANTLYREESYREKLTVIIEDIPEDVLESIFPAPDFVEELNNVFTLFDSGYFTFIPFKKSSELETLLNFSLDSNRLLTLKSDSSLSVRELALLDIRENSRMNLEKYQQQTEIQNEIMACIKKNVHTLKNETVSLLAHKIDSFYHEIPLKAKIADETFTTNAEIMTKYTAMTNKISIELKKKLQFELSKLQTAYIETILFLTDPEFSNKKISLLMIANWKKITQTYVEHFNQFYGKDILHPCAFSLADYEKEPKKIFRMLREKIAEINEGKGVVILTDSFFPVQLKKKLDRKDTLLILENLTFNSIAKITSMAIDPDAEIDDLKNFEKPAERYPITELSHDLIDEIDTHILRKNLAFLDSKKALAISSVVLKDILQDLNIDYRNEIAISFLLHTSFMIERVIKKETLMYKGISKLVNGNTMIYQSIDTRFKKINDFFNIVIPSSEIAYVVEIFIDYLKYHSAALTFTP